MLHSNLCLACCFISLGCLDHAHTGGFVTTTLEAQWSSLQITEIENRPAHYLEVDLKGK